MTSNVKVEAVKDDWGRQGISISANPPPNATDEERQAASDAVALASCKLLGIEPPEVLVERAKARSASDKPAEAG